MNRHQQRDILEAIQLAIIILKFCVNDFAFERFWDLPRFRENANTA